MSEFIINKDYDPEDNDLVVKQKVAWGSTIRFEATLVDIQRIKHLTYGELLRFIFRTHTENYQSILPDEFSYTCSSQLSENSELKFFIERLTNQQLTRTEMNETGFNLRSLIGKHVYYMLIENQADSDAVDYVIDELWGKSYSEKNEVENDKDSEMRSITRFE